MRRLILHLRNPDDQVPGCDYVLVNTIIEESETSAKGKECECVDGPIASSAAELQMIFACPTAGLRKLFLQFKYSNGGQSFNVGICDVKGM